MRDTKDEKRKSNAEIAAENHAAMQRYLGAVDAVPFRLVGDTQVANISAICRAAGVDRQVYNTRADIKQLVEDAVKAKGLGVPKHEYVAPGADAVPAWATQRIKDLEEQVAVAKAESRELREQLRRYEDMERHLTATGMLPR